MTPEASPAPGGATYADIAEEQFANVNAFYALDDGTGLYRPMHPEQPEDRPIAYLWPYSALVSGLGARARYRKDDESLADFITSLETLERYFDANSTPPAYDSFVIEFGGGDKFYDDNQWLGMDFSHAFRLTGDEKWLEKSRLMWDFSESGWSDEDHGGGIYWKENDISTKNTCSNGPAAVHALMLYEDTGEQAYLDWAVRIMEWLELLYDEAIGVYFDHVSIDGRIDRTRWTYNTGTPMEASALLYRATGDQAWLEKARGLAAASIEYFAPTQDANGVRGFPPTPWFNSVLHRGYCTLFDIDPDADRTYIDALPSLLQRAWANNRTDDGLLPPDWAQATAAGEPLDLLEQAAVVEIASMAARYAQ